MSKHTAAHSSCGCSVTLRKTCDCPNAAQVDVTQCAMHEAAPDLLAALEEIEWVPHRPASVDEWWGCPSCIADRASGHMDGCKLAAAIVRAKLPA